MSKIELMEKSTGENKYWISSFLKTRVQKDRIACGSSDLE